MSTAQLLVLGALAGFTIFLGLPLGRVRNASPKLKAFFSATATGILLFLLVEVLIHAVEPVEEALIVAANEGGSWSHFFELATICIVGGVVGLMSLVYYSNWLGKQRAKSMLGPGAASAAEFETRWTSGLTPASWLALLIAIGIGLHNFSEGLAIGQSAAQDEVTLALLLIIGFGLHNATEGFGIVAPLSGAEGRPSWRFLALLGIIGGGADVPRHVARPGVRQRGRGDRFPRAGGGLDPLRRDRADERQPAAGLQDARGLVTPVRPLPGFRHGFRPGRRRRVVASAA